MRLFKLFKKKSERVARRVVTADWYYHRSVPVVHSARKQLLNPLTAQLMLQIRNRIWFPRP